MRRTLSLIITVLVVAGLMPVATASVREIAKYAGLRPTVVPVVGTGSMYPSLFWETSEGGPDNPGQMSVQEYRTTPRMYHRFPGFELANQTFLRRPISFGDMIAFQNPATVAILTKEGKDTKSGFIKRVIGLPGDTLELRDGYVKKNGQDLEEPYIYKPRSTYGGEFLSDCKQFVVPEGKYFVMGDNRKTSEDSRGELGLIDDRDITFVLPFDQQQIYHSLWRDTSRDAELSGTPTLVAEEFYRAINLERQKANISSLRPHSLLVRSSALKGQSYLAGQPLSLGQATTRAGYSNILTAEFITPGNYTADELLQNLLYFADTSTQILDPQYQEIGVAAVKENIDGCPTQVIVGHLGGYVPAEYEADTVSGWANLANNLEQVIPSWEKALAYPQIDQTKLQQLLLILRRRLTLAREIYAVMSDNKWLTPEQESRIQADSGDAENANNLIQELNQE